jgi:hypothetical protein
VHHHPGAWVYSDVEGCNIWSCCLNFQHDSRGCEGQVVNPDRWCTIGYERCGSYSARR